MRDMLGGRALTALEALESALMVTQAQEKWVSLTKQTAHDYYFPSKRD